MNYSRFMASVGLSAEMSKTVALLKKTAPFKTRYYYEITKQELLEFVLLFYEEKIFTKLEAHIVFIK